MKTRVTLKDIAREANVTQATVSLALNDAPRISAQTRKRVKDLAKRMAYRPSLTARALRQNRTHLAGIVLQNLSVDAANRRLEAIERALDQSGYQVLLGMTHGRADLFEAAVHSMIERGVDGLILTGLGYVDREASEWQNIRALLENIDLPCVAVGSNMNVNLPVVGMDVKQGVSQLLEHLAGFGHERIMLAGDFCSVYNYWKWLAICEFRQRHPQVDVSFFHIRDGSFITPRRKRLPLKYGDILPVEKLQSLSQAGARTLIEQNRLPTALIGTNDHIAASFMLALKDAGLRVPEDISIAGHDEHIFAQYLRPSLTTIRQESDVIGKSAVDILLERLGARDEADPAEATAASAQTEDPLQSKRTKRGSVLFTPPLVVRESTGPAPQRSRD